MGNKWVQFVLDLLIVSHGRPFAIALLIWLCTVSFLKDWPLWLPPLPKSIETVVSFTGNSLSDGQAFMFDRYQKQSPRKPLSQPVTIVAIDEKSLAQIGQWPWPRHRLAKLIDQINLSSPAAIGLDIYMPEVDQTSPSQIAKHVATINPMLATELRKLPSNDTILASSLHRSPSILGSAGFDFPTYTTSKELTAQPVLIKGRGLPPYIHQYPAVLASLPELQNAAKSQAVLSVQLESGLARKIPLISRINEQPVGSLAMEMFRVATGSPVISVDVDFFGIRHVQVADLAIPTQAAGEVYLHYAKQADTTARYVSASDVLSGKTAPDAFNQKLVLIGVTGIGINDYRTTTLGETVPGIEIQAQLIEALFDGRFLIRPWWMKFAELAAILGISLLMIWILPKTTDSKTLGAVHKVPKLGMLFPLAFNFIAVGLGFYVFQYFGLLFDAATFVLIVTAVFGSLLASVQSTLLKRKYENEFKK